MDIPDLQSRVEPEPHLFFEWRAFRDLNTDRPVAFGCGPIPWMAIDRYASRFSLDAPDEFGRFLRLIRAMDDAFLGWHAERDAK